MYVLYAPQLGNRKQKGERERQQKHPRKDSCAVNVPHPVFANWADQVAR